MDTSKAPHKKVKLGKDTYYITRYPEGDAHIHISRPWDQDGYGGAIVSFLLEDGTIEKVKGPYCCDGMFDFGTAAKIAKALNDPSINAEATRLVVGRNLDRYCKVSKEPQEIVFEEKEWSLAPVRDRLRPEWKDLEIAVHIRGAIAYRTYDRLMDAPHDR